MTTLVISDNVDVLAFNSRTSYRDTKLKLQTFANRLALEYDSHEFVYYPSFHTNLGYYMPASQPMFLFTTDDSSTHKFACTMLHSFHSLIVLRGVPDSCATTLCEKVYEYALELPKISVYDVSHRWQRGY